MDTAHWLQAACENAERRGLAGLKPLLDTLARSTAALREADLVARSVLRELQDRPEPGPRAAGDGPHSAPPDVRHGMTPGMPTE